MGSASKEGLSGGTKDDSWLHKDLDDRKVVRKVNMKYRTQKKDMKKSEVELLLSKGVTGRTLNRAKLVKRATQVRGKDGKMYTRMQWIDPNKDMPTMDDATIQDDATKPKSPKINVDFWNGDEKLEASKVKVYDTGTQKGYIDKTLDGLSKEEKQAMISKFGLTWKRNQHANIDWKNAVMALKDYLYENPSLMGADHLPKEGNGKTNLSGTDKINAFCNKLTKEDQYNLMKKYGIYDDVDPRLVPEYASKSEGGDGTGAIRHMKNMMALKKYLGENSHLMGDVDSKPETPKEKKDTKPKEEPKKTPAQKGNNDMDTILKTMSDVDKYNLMRKCGIADTDPRQDPRYDKFTGDSTGAIRHMKNMMQLKKHIALHPEDLSDKLGDEGVSKQKEQTKKEQVKEKKSTEVKDVLAKLSKESKLSLLKRFANEPEIKNRERKDNPSIDYMRSMMALKSFLEKNPDKLKEVGDMAEFDELMSLKLPVKMIEKILRDIVGITSTQMDYAVVVEKGKEWKFGISSFAMIQTNDDGQPVLSVVDTGDDGAGWEEYEYPMSQIRDFVNKAKEDKAKAKEEAKDTVTRNEIPLHKKSISDIEKTLNKDFDQYTNEVGEVMKPILAHYWDKVGHVNNLNDIVNKSYMTYDTMKSLMDKYNVSVDNKGYFNSSSDSWLSIACFDRITSTKTGNANDYLFVNKSTGETSAFALKESAKQWTSEERYEARGDLISSSLNIGETEGAESMSKGISTHLNNGTNFVPFDLMADMMANGLKFDFTGDGLGCSYVKTDNTIQMSKLYLNPSLLAEGKQTFEYQPKRCHPMGEATAHEFAHAIDGFFTDKSKSGFLNWNTDIASKYVDSNYKNCVRESYYSKVDKSNPAREMVKISFNGIDSYYHKDEWMNVYEARVYGAKDSDFTDNGSGTLLDTRSGTATSPMNNSVAVEHWSENVSRYAKAFDLFKQYKDKNPNDKDMTMDSWAKKMYDEFKSKGYGDDYTQEQAKGYSLSNGESGTMRGSYHIRDKYPMESTGYLYHRMKENYPVLWEGIDHILNRPDFRSDKNTPKPTEMADKGEFTRKSLLVVRR